MWHSSVAASRLASLLLACVPRGYAALVAPRDPGASTLSVHTRLLLRNTSHVGSFCCIAALTATSCAPALVPPAADVLRRAQTAGSYSGRLSVSLRGEGLRARTKALLAFERPDSLRLEIPGPSGARLLAVASGGRFTAVFPSERAVFKGAADAAQLEAVLGVGLTPSEVMDLLVGVAPPRTRYRARWGPSLPREIEAFFSDGGRLKVVVEDADVGVRLSGAAFLPPPHLGYREVDAAEARGLWSRR
jgi:hypothetical protein